MIIYMECTLLAMIAEGKPAEEVNEFISKSEFKTTKTDINYCVFNLKSYENQETIPE